MYVAADFSTGSLAVRDAGVVMTHGLLRKGAAGAITVGRGGTLDVDGLAGVSAMSIAGTLVFSPDDATVFAGSIGGTGRLVKRGSGTLTLQGENYVSGTTSVLDGRVRLENSSALMVSPVEVSGAGVLDVAADGVSLWSLAVSQGGLAALPSSAALTCSTGALFVDETQGGGRVDVGTGRIVVAAGGISVTDLVSDISAGRNGGSWDGVVGVMSTAVSAAILSGRARAIGWTEGGDGSLTFAFAAPGDSNLDWTLDILDAGNFLTGAKFDTGLPATWAEGDFNYDNSVDILDAADFFATNLYDAGPYNAPAGGISAVPEPSMLGLMGAGAGVAGSMLMRRRRAV
jgi:autotransporter-associated beta strand protein